MDTLREPGPLKTIPQPPNMELSIVLTTFAKEDFLCFRISFRKIEGFFSC